MNKITVTEALAELKTLEKRIEKKIHNVTPYVVRQEALRDPLADKGGSRKYIDGELQGISDLQEYRLGLRRAIQESNESTEITVFGESRTIADWLMWRREVLPQLRNVYTLLLHTVEQARGEASRKGYNISQQDGQRFSMDFIVNVDEAAVREKLEQLENIDGTLDGKLSLKNAVVVIEP